MDSLREIINHPKLEDGNYHELINALSKKIQDPNIVVFGLALDVLGKLAGGLKKNFAVYRHNVMPNLIERFKESKKTIINYLQNTMDLIFASGPVISEVLDDLMVGLSHTSPNIKAETLLFVSRALKLKGSKSKLGKSEIKLLSMKMADCLNDAAPNVRDAASTALAEMIHSFTEASVVPFLQNIDKLKFSKVLDLAAAPNANQSAPPKPATAKTVPIVAPVVVKSQAKLATKSNQKASLSQANLVSKQPMLSESINYDFSDETSIEFVTSFMGQDVTSLEDPNWKTRLEGVTNIFERVKANKIDKAEPIVRFLLQKVCSKDKNFQVVATSIQCLSYLARKEYGFSNGCVVLVLNGLAEKLGDMKVKKLTADLFDSCVVCSSFNLVLSELYPLIQAMKAPKMISDALSWANSALREFGLGNISTAKMTEFLREILNHSNQSVRSAGIDLICTLKKLGKNLRPQLNDLGPGTLKALDSELEKVKCESLKPARAEEVTTNSSTQDSAEVTDFSVKLRTGILNQMGDPNWKERKAALEEFKSIIDGCAPPLSAAIPSDVVLALKLRLNDNNKSLALMACEITGVLAAGIGKPFERYSKIFCEHLLSHISDLKQIVRTRVLTVLDQYRVAIGLESLIPCISSGLLVDQPITRKELLKWTFDHQKALADESIIRILLHPVFLCLQDRNADVRKCAGLLLEFCSENLGSRECREKAQELFKGAQFASLAPYLDKLPTEEKAAPTAEKGSPAAPLLTGQTNQRVRPASKQKPSTVEISHDKVKGELMSTDLKLKAARMSADRGINKWSFETPRPDLIDLLEEQCRLSFDQEIVEVLFSTAHYKEKDFAEGLVRFLTYFKESSDKKKAINCAVANCDIILKYLTLRFFDSNTSIFKLCLDLLDILFGLLEEASYSLSEYEAQSFLPLFISKLGDPKEILRVKLRGILKSIARVYPVSKLFLFLLKGLESKNSRVKIECLDEIVVLINRNGSSVFVPAKTIPVLANQIGDRDSNIRNSALNCIVAVFNVVGDQMYQFMSKIGDKEKDMIQERLKRAPQKTAKVADFSLHTGENESSKIAVPGKPKTSGSKGEFSLDLDKLNLFSGPSFENLNLKTTAKERIISIGKINVDEKLDKILLSLSTFDLEGTLDAIKGLEKLLQENPTGAFINTKDIVGKLNIHLFSAINNLATNNILGARLCRHFIAVLVSIFNSESSSVLVPVDSLEDLVRKLLYKLVDPDVQKFDTTKNLVRTLNMLMVRIIENSKPNSTFKILLKILRDSSLKSVIQIDETTMALETKYTELVMKCIWKITKVIPQYISDGKLDTESLLVCVDEFLNEAPPSYWKRKVQETGNNHSDMPLRTTKTILHELVNILGQDITYYKAVKEGSHLQVYIKQLLANAVRKKNKELGTPGKPGVSHDQALETTMNLIMQKISSQNETKQGLQELFDLTKRHPINVINDRVEKESTYVQDYIKRGLVRLQANAASTSG